MKRRSPFESMAPYYNGQEIEIVDYRTVDDVTYVVIHDGKETKLVPLSEIKFSTRKPKGEKDAA